jgi:hypothetical protein
MADSVSQDVATRLASLTQDVRHFLYAVDRGYLGDIGPTVFIDALRVAVAK